MTNGTYEVTLKLAETFFTYRNARVFSVTAEGQQVVKDLDIYAAAGPDTRLDKTFRVTVGDGSLDLGFSATRNNAKVDAILVKKVSGGAVVTPAPRPTTPTPVVTTPPTAPPRRAAGAAPPVTAPPVVAPPSSRPPRRFTPTTPQPGTANASGHAWKSGSSGVGAADGTVRGLAGQQPRHRRQLGRERRQLRQLLHAVERCRVRRLERVHGHGRRRHRRRGDVVAGRERRATTRAGASPSRS